MNNDTINTAADTTEEVVKIFVPNFVDTNDYSKAAEQGDLIFMTEGVVMMSAQELHKKFKIYFDRAIEGDLLLLSGSNLLCAVAYAEWCRRFPNSREILVHNRKYGYQFMRVVDNG